MEKNSGKFSFIRKFKAMMGGEEDKDEEERRQKAEGERT